MLFNYIRLGDRVEITTLDSGGGRAYISQVEEITGDDELLIHMPILYGQLVKLPANERYSMRFYTEKGTLLFMTEITGYKKEQQFVYMTVKIVSQGERTQNRRFYRFGCLLPLKFAKITEDLSEDVVGKEELADGIIKDIGAGGVRFVSNTDIVIHSKIKCIIMLGEECIIAIGIIRRKDYFPKSNYKYQHSVQFLSISQDEQEKIIKFVFAEQRKELMRTKTSRNDMQ